MKPSDELFKLIKSLNKNEKRYFKLQSALQKGEKNYLRLFAAMESQEEYDESEIKKIFAGEPFIQRLTVAKQYLYDMIMACLRRFNAETNVENKLSDLLKDVEILYNKRLYVQCRKNIEKGKALALKYEKRLQMLQFYRLENLLIRSQHMQHITQPMLEKINKEVDEIIETYKITHKASFLFSKIYLFYVETGATRNKTELKTLLKMVENPFFKQVEFTKSIHAKLFSYRSKALCYQNTNNNKTFLWLQKSVTLLEENPHYITEDPELYITSLNNFIVGLLILKKHDNIIDSINKLKNIRVKSEKDRFNIFILSSILEIKYYISKGNFHQGLKCIPGLLNVIDKYILDAESKRRKILCFFNISYLYLGAGFFKEAKKYLNKIFELSEVGYKSDLFAIVKILILIIHYELANQELLEHYARSTYRYLFKRERLFKFESIILNFMRKNMPVISTKNEILNAFKKLRADILLCMKDPSEANIIGYFDFIAWIDSKIENCSMGEIIKRNLENNQPAN